MNICANHCSYLINFNYVIGLKENIDVVSRHLINMHCVWRYSNVDRYWWKRNHFYLIKVTRPLMSKKRNSCFDKSRDILIDSHLCFEASQNSMLHSVLRSFKIRDRGGQKLNEQWNMFSYILTWVINFARTLTNRSRHSDRKRIQSK